MNRKFDIIYADPPWSYRDKALSGNRGASCKYQTQSSNWLNCLPIKKISNDNCILFLWVTMPKIDECLKLIKCWGFKYKTCAFVWVKRNKISKSYFWGMGRWTRANAEICLLATKGKPKRLSASVSQIVAKPITFHSAKLNCVRKRIVKLMGDLPRIELFARNRKKYQDGWVNLGNEVDGQDICKALKQIRKGTYLNE